MKSGLVSRRAALFVCQCPKELWARIKMCFQHGTDRTKASGFLHSLGCRIRGSALDKLSSESPSQNAEIESEQATYDTSPPLEWIPPLRQSFPKQFGPSLTAKASLVKREVTFWEWIGGGITQPETSSLNLISMVGQLTTVLVAC